MGRLVGRIDANVGFGGIVVGMLTGRFILGWMSYWENHWLFMFWNTLPSSEQVVGFILFQQTVPPPGAGYWYILRLAHILPASTEDHGFLRFESRNTWSPFDNFVALSFFL